MSSPLIQGKAVAAALAFTAAAIAAGYLAYTAVTSTSSGARCPTGVKVQKHKDQLEFPVHPHQRALKRKAESTEILQDTQRNPKRCRSEPLPYRHTASPQPTPLPSVSHPRVSHVGSGSGSSRDLVLTTQDAVLPTASSDAEDDASESEYADLELFRPVIRVMNFRALERTALDIRIEVHQDDKRSMESQYKLPHDLSCTVDNEPKHGSYNIVYFITFSDGIRWVARFPGHGLRFTDLDKTKMNGEYHTMRYIKAKTTIPLPRIFCWETEATLIGAPFASMEMLPGRPLQEIWSNVLSKHQQLRVLDDTARYVSQLAKLEFRTSGQLRFDAQGNFTEIGSQIFLDSAFEAGWGQTIEVGPYNSFVDYLDDLWPQDEEHSTAARGAIAHILQMAVESIPNFADGSCPITLAMTDLDSQNVLVDDQGTVTGFIDWDCVATERMSAGCARYPAWLTTDWGAPNHFQADHLAEFDRDPHALEKASHELITLRRYYAEAFAGYASVVQPRYDPRSGCVSYLLAAIEAAIQDSINRTEIVWKMLRHAFGEEPTFSPKQYADAFDIDQHEEYNEVIRKCFATMWHAEWDIEDE